MIGSTTTPGAVPTRNGCFAVLKPDVPCDAPAPPTSRTAQAAIAATSPDPITSRILVMRFSPLLEWNKSAGVSHRSRRIGPCTPGLIRITYGHKAARGLLHRGRAQELLARGRAARAHATGRQPADPLAREALRPAAPRPLRTSGGADGGGAPPVPARAEAAQ